MKKLIIILSIMMMIIGIKAKAIEIDLAPKKTVLHYLDPYTEIDSYLQFNPPYQEANWGEYGTYDMITTFNDPQRMQGLRVYGDGWEKANEDGNIIEFKTALYWYAPNDTTKYVYPFLVKVYSSEEDTQETRCMNTGEEFMNNNGTRVLIDSWKCISPIKPYYFLIGFNSQATNHPVVQTQIMISSTFNFRNATSQQEIEEILANTTYESPFHYTPEQLVDMINNNEWYAPGLSNEWNLNTKDIEDDLWWYMREEDWNNKGVSIDTNASTWIWDKANTILHTNTHVWGLYLSALGVCLIRLVLG